MTNNQLTDKREAVRAAHAAWSDKTFGSVGPIGPLKHLSKEALEAAAEPGDLSEWADMQFLLWDAQRRAGITDEQITQAMMEKLAVNESRDWPEPKDGEPRFHVKSGAELQEHRKAVEDKDLLGVIDALEHPAGINAAGKQVVRRALVELQEHRKAQPVEVTFAMAYAFHHALADSPLGSDEAEEIKTGLRAALANVTVPAELQEHRKAVEPELKPANLVNKFYERYPVASFKSDTERAAALGYFMAGAELQCFGEFVKYEDMFCDE